VFFLSLLLRLFLLPDCLVVNWHRITCLPLSKLRDPFSLVFDPLEDVVVVFGCLADWTVLLAFVEELL
jgi:hypothetical protein